MLLALTQPDAAFPETSGLVVAGSWYVETCLLRITAAFAWSG
ncbi:hypothetical protein XOC_3577 [Xanthomonas oryzae pv. oryzicola BLS256]|uniref:Uncharacterized protein n=1 Tax=Xanthomonas oryzae pv. oryzicola (strain BLS256) TaxID=383407 RepID=G7TEF2_XANOB|nr:hypothetical protein XOC_3577 [Xanthomonas oryzae pv. oryzicola BLS256]QEO96178.1 hypothetical protein XOCgx_1184 [Xanthomonas oryzae pv. oryzicola]